MKDLIAYIMQLEKDGFTIESRKINAEYDEKENPLGWKEYDIRKIEITIKFKK